MKVSFTSSLCWLTTKCFQRDFAEFVSSINIYSHTMTKYLFGLGSLSKPCPLYRTFFWLLFHFDWINRKIGQETRLLSFINISLRASGKFSGEQIFLQDLKAFQKAFSKRRHSTDPSEIQRWKLSIIFFPLFKIDFAIFLRTDWSASKSHSWSSCLR